MAKFKLKQTGSPAGENAQRVRIAIALLLIQAVSYLLVAQSGREQAYRYMLIPTLLIIFGGWMLVRLIHASESFFLYATLLLTFGTIIQCMLLKEDGKPGLMYYYIAAFVIAVVAGALYTKMPIIASAQGVSAMIVGTAVLYILTLMLGVSAADGVTNWIKLGPVTVQPSEFIKIAYVLILAGLLCSTENPGKKRVWTAIGVTLMNLVFLIIQGELGTCLLILGVFLCFVFLFVPDMKWFGVSFFLLISCAAGGTMIVLKCHGEGGGMIRKLINKVYRRIFVGWLDPNSDPDASYQIRQARKALLNSHLFGSETTTYIPYKDTDMVFPTLTEHCGLVIALVVCILFVILIVRGTFIYFTCAERYHQAVCAGLCFQFIMQAFIIIGGSTGLMPLTGVTLPLISRGGSSLMATFISIAIILIISSGKLWSGRRDYSDYDSKLQKARANYPNRVHTMRTRNHRRSAVDDSGK